MTMRHELMKLLKKWNITEMLGLRYKLTTAIINLIIRELPPEKKIEGRNTDTITWVSDCSHARGYNQYRNHIITLLRGEE